MWDSVNFVVAIVVLLLSGGCAALIVRERRVILGLLQEQEPATHARLCLGNAGAGVLSGEFQRYLMRRDYRSSGIAAVRERGHRAWLYSMMALGGMALLTLLQVGKGLWRIL